MLSIHETPGEDIIKKQNSDDNKYGQFIQVLFITLAGAEGLSLQNIRSVNIMEPFWNMVKINQVIGRARRNFSHSNLPLDQRNVRIYENIGLFTLEQLSGEWASNIKYTEIFTEDTDGDIQGDSGKRQITEDQKRKKVLGIAHKFTSDVSSIDNNETSDQDLLEKSKKKDKIMSGFLSLIKESAIDCQNNKSDNIQGDPTNLQDMTCTKSNNYPSTTPLGSNVQYINVPGKSLEGKVISGTESNISRGKKIIKLPIPTQFGNYNISGILYGDTGIIYDLYYYYGLDPILKGGPTFIQRPIGTASYIDGEWVGSVNQDFYKEEYQETLLRYNEIEKIRINLASLPGSKFKGLPEIPSVIYNWSRAIRSDVNLERFKSIDAKTAPIGIASEVLKTSPSLEVKEEAVDPFELLGVDSNITAKELAVIVKSGKLTTPQKRAVKEIMKRWRK